MDPRCGDSDNKHQAESGPRTGGPAPSPQAMTTEEALQALALLLTDEPRLVIVLVGWGQEILTKPGGDGKEAPPRPQPRPRCFYDILLGPDLLRDDYPVTIKPRNGNDHRFFQTGSKDEVRLFMELCRLRAIADDSPALADGVLTHERIDALWEGPPHPRNADAKERARRIVEKVKRRLRRAGLDPNRILANRWGEGWFLWPRPRVRLISKKRPPSALGRSINCRPPGGGKKYDLTEDIPDDSWHPE